MQWCNGDLEESAEGNIAASLLPTLNYNQRRVFNDVMLRQAADICVRAVKDFAHSCDCDFKVYHKGGPEGLPTKCRSWPIIDARQDNVLAQSTMQELLARASDNCIFLIASAMAASKCCSTDAHEGRAVRTLVRCPVVEGIVTAFIIYGLFVAEAKANTSSLTTGLVTYCRSLRLTQLVLALALATAGLTQGNAYGGISPGIFLIPPKF